MEFKKEINYTFDDIFIHQQLSNIKSRTQVDINPMSPLSTTIPLISSNMNSVTGKRMAEKLARFWWIWVLPQDMPLEKMLEVISYVHNADLKLDTPLTVKASDTIRTATWIIEKRSHQSVVMMDDFNKPIAVFKGSDLEKFNEDEYEILQNIHQRKLVTWNEWISDEEAFDLMEEHRISSLPIINKTWTLIGILTRDDCIRNSLYTPATINWHLDIAVALSVNWYEEKLDKIIKAWVNTIFLDTAHWYTHHMADAIKLIKKKHPHIILVAWNLMGKKWTQHLLEAWADWVKIWIWPGWMCTTRMMTWVWRPQFSAILESIEVAKSMWKFVIADWWIKYPRDLSLSMAAWASHIMLWTILVGTYESPPSIEKEWNDMYKKSWWMASGKAVLGRTKELSKFEQAKRERFQEWVSNAKVYNIQPLGNIVDKFTTWLVSAMTYTGANNLKEFNKKAIIWVQNPSWFKEWTPHGK